MNSRLRSVMFILICMLPFAVVAQSDTALVSFKKLVRKRLALPYDASYTDKEFLLDSIRNSTEESKYIRFRAQVLPRQENQKIPRYLSRRFLKLDTAFVNEYGDTFVAEFFALGTIVQPKPAVCVIIERQFVGYNYRSSEKFLCTFDKKYKPVEYLRLAGEIPPDIASDDNYDILNNRFNRLPWFDETEGLIYKDLSIILANEIGKLKKYMIKETGQIQKK